MKTERPVGPYSRAEDPEMWAQIVDWQDERIAELESHLAACTEYLEDLQNHIANASWTRHQQAEADDIEQFITNHKALLNP